MTEQESRTKTPFEVWRDRVHASDRMVSLLWATDSADLNFQIRMYLIAGEMTLLQVWKDGGFEVFCPVGGNDMDAAVEAALRGDTTD